MQRDTREHIAPPLSGRSKKNVAAGLLRKKAVVAGEAGAAGIAGEAKEGLHQRWGEQGWLGCVPPEAGSH